MINRETIWNETCTNRWVRIGDSNTRLCILTAIHHYNGMHGVSELNLITELQVRVKEDNASHVTEITLSPEDMEDLAAYLTEAAKHARELKARIDEDAAEISAAAEEALRQAKEAA